MGGAVPSVDWREPSAWRDATLAACLIAVDPVSLAGVRLRAAPGPVRDRWLALLRDLVPANVPWRRIPAGVGEDRLLGGLDLASTLAAGQRIVARGLLAECDGGYLIVPMAERLDVLPSALIAGALDTGVVAVERDGVSGRHGARFAMVLLDEGGAGEQPPAAILERVGLHAALDGIHSYEATAASFSRQCVDRARAQLADVTVPDDLVRDLSVAAIELGIGSLRAPLMAVRAARAAAALCGRTEAGREDALLAARLVLGPRATRLPEAAPPPPPEQPETPPPEAGADEGTRSVVEDLVLDATRVALAAGTLASLNGGGARRHQRGVTGAGGRAGPAEPSRTRGRKAGVSQGAYTSGVRLDLLATLRAAAPWQGVRNAGAATGGSLIRVRQDDFRIARLKHRRRTTTIFVVDASGSAAMHRLAEAKGAVEHLLCECYVRRDEVALITFRDRRADIILPPTRSLTRARMRLAALPGGGGTPIASAIETARQAALAVRRAGHRPVLVFLSDGQANIDREGQPGRGKAEADAVACGKVLRADTVPTLFIDTSPRPQAKAQRLAEALGAAYLPMPKSGSRGIMQAVNQLAGQPI
jgi:magnesium chelatase subunit D